MKILAIAILSLTSALGLAQDLNNVNNVELSNLDGAVGWALASTYSLGATSIVVQSGSGVPSMGSRFTLSQDAAHLDQYKVTGSVGAGPVTLTFCRFTSATTCSGGLLSTYTSGTVLYWLPDVSTSKTIPGCTPADATEVCVGYKSAHAGDTRVIMSRTVYASIGLNPERWACAVADPCPRSGPAGDSTTTHVVKIKKIFPLLDAYAGCGAACDQVWGFWASSIRTDTGAYSSLGHLADVFNGTGMLSPLIPAAANPAGAYDLRLYTFGSSSVYAGHAFPIQLATAKVGGAVSAQVYFKTVVLNDGSDHACTLNHQGGTCADGISFWFLTSLMNYFAGTPSTDYLLTASACGPIGPCMYYPDYQLGLSQFDRGNGTSSNQQQAFLWVKTTNGVTTPGAYILRLTLQGVTTGVDVGTGATANYGFTVAATPTPSEVKATSFPAVYNATNGQGFMGYYSYQFCQAPTTGQLWNYSQGALDNGNYPSAETRLYYYDGSREEFELGDFVGAIATNWQASHPYPYGTLIKPTAGNAGGYVYYTYPTSLGAINGLGGTSTSASSQPAWPQAWGSTVADAGGTSYFNVGTAQNHYQCAQANLDPFRNFMMVAVKNLQEWSATVSMSMLMDRYRTNDLKCKGSTVPGCAGGSTVVANDVNAISQLYTSSGASIDTAVYKVAAVADGFDVRSVADAAQYAVAGDLLLGTTDVMEGVRVDSILSILNQCSTLRSYADVDYQSNSFVLGTACKTLYGALETEALINYYNKELLANRYHPEVPSAVKAYLDATWTNGWCTTPGATCASSGGYNSGQPAAFLYTGASFPPFIPFDYTETELNLLNAGAFSWMYSITADATYRTRGDAVFGNAFNNPSHMYAAKTLGQQRNYLDYLKMRDGTRVSTVNGHVYAPFGVFQDTNPCNSGEAFPCTIASTIGDATFPFNFNVASGSRSGTPQIAGCNSTGCVFTWSTPESAPHNWVAYGASANNCNQLSADSTSNVKINDWTWQHVVVINNAGSNSTYYAAPRSQSDAGVVSQERCNPNYSALYLFTTQATTSTIKSGIFKSVVAH